MMKTLGLGWGLETGLVMVTVTVTVTTTPPLLPPGRLGLGLLASRRPLALWPVEPRCSTMTSSNWLCTVGTECWRFEAALCVMLVEQVLSSTLGSCAGL